MGVVRVAESGEVVCPLGVHSVSIGWGILRKSVGFVVSVVEVIAVRVAGLVRTVLLVIFLLLVSSSWCPVRVITSSGWFRAGSSSCVAGFCGVVRTPLLGVNLRGSNKIGW